MPPNGLNQKILRPLSKILDQMEARLDDPKAFITSNQNFHLRIAKAAKNHILEDFIVNIRNLLKSNIALVIEKSDDQQEVPGVPPKDL